MDPAVSVFNGLDHSTLMDDRLNKTDFHQDSRSVGISNYSIFHLQLRVYQYGAAALLVETLYLLILITDSSIRRLGHTRPSANLGTPIITDNYLISI